jgi:hypothetical protein
MKQSDFVSSNDQIKTTKLSNRDNFENLYVAEDDTPPYLGFGHVDDDEADEKKSKKKKPKKKNPKAGSTTATAPAGEPKVQPTPSGRTKPTTPAVTVDTDRGPARPSFAAPPSDRLSVQSGQNVPPGRTAPSLIGPGGLDSDRPSKTPARQSQAAIDSSKLTGKRPTSIAGKINSLFGSRLAGGMMTWLGPVLVAGKGAKFLADWYSYNTGAARVTQLGDYTAPCLDSNYDPYNDPFVDIYSDEADTTYRLDYYGGGFKDILNSYNVEAFTPRMSNLIYGVIPTLLTSVATGAVLFQTIGRIAFAVSGATGPGILIGTAAAILSIGAGWIVSYWINKMLKSVDKWGPGAADVVAQFAMEQLTTSRNLQKLCSADLSEAAQDDEDQDRDEESTRSAAVDTFAIMDLAVTIKQVFKEIDQELQAEGDQEKLAEWRRTLKQAKEMAKDQIKG